MFVGLCIPRVEMQDLRPDVPLELSFVVSSAHKASFLMLDVRLVYIYYLMHHSSVFLVFDYVLRYLNISAFFINSLINLLCSGLLALR